MQKIHDPHRDPAHVISDLDAGLEPGERNLRRGVKVNGTGSLNEPAVDDALYLEVGSPTSEGIGAHGRFSAALPCWIEGPPGAPYLRVLNGGGWPDLSQAPITNWRLPGGGQTGLPAYTPGVLVAGTFPDAEERVFLPVISAGPLDPGLVAHHRPDAPPSISSIVSDMLGTDPGVSSGLETAWFLAEALNTLSRTHQIALNGLASAETPTGHGLAIAISRASQSVVAGSEPEHFVVYGAPQHGGPILTPKTTDPHRQGPGVKHFPLMFDLHLVKYGPGPNGQAPAPLKFELRDLDPRTGVHEFRTFGRIVYDPSQTHPNPGAVSGQPAPGMWVIEVETPFTIWAPPPEENPPDHHTEPPNPRTPGPGGHGGGPGPNPPPPPGGNPPPGPGGHGGKGRGGGPPPPPGGNPPAPPAERDDNQAEDGQEEPEEDPVGGIMPPDMPPEWLKWLRKLYKGYLKNRKKGNKRVANWYWKRIQREIEKLLKRLKKRRTFEARQKIARGKVWRQRYGEIKEERRKKGQSPVYGPPIYSQGGPRRATRFDHMLRLGQERNQWRDDIDVSDEEFSRREALDAQHDDLRERRARRFGSFRESDRARITETAEHLAFRAEIPLNDQANTRPVHPSLLVAAFRKQTDLDGGEPLRTHHAVGVPALTPLVMDPEIEQEFGTCYSGRLDPEERKVVDRARIGGGSLRGFGDTRPDAPTFGGSRRRKWVNGGLILAGEDIRTQNDLAGSRQSELSPYLALRDEACLAFGKPSAQRNGTVVSGFRIYKDSSDNLIFDPVDSSGSTDATKIVDVYGGLRVAADAKVSGQVLAKDGTKTSPGMAFLNDTDTGLFRSGSGEIGISCNDTTKVLVNSTGVTIEGELHVTQKVTFDDEIDPTYLVMTKQASARSMSANEVAFWGKDDGSGVTRPFITDDVGSTEEIQTVERHGGLLGTVTSTFTQANNTSEQTAASATMAADRASVGMLVRIRASGYISNNSGSAVEFQLRARYGGLTGDIICEPGPYDLATGMNNRGWTLDTQAVIRTVGATGTIQGGAALCFINDDKVSAVPGSAVTVDTTASNDIVITVTKDTADATAYLTLEEASIEILGLM